MELKLEFGGQSCGVSIFLPKGTKPEKKAADELKSMMELTGTFGADERVRRFFGGKGTLCHKGSSDSGFS